MDLNNLNKFLNSTGASGSNSSPSWGGEASSSRSTPIRPIIMPPPPPPPMEPPPPPPPPPDHHHHHHHLNKFPFHHHHHDHHHHGHEEMVSSTPPSSSASWANFPLILQTTNSNNNNNNAQISPAAPPCLLLAAAAAAAGGSSNDGNNELGRMGAHPFHDDQDIEQEEEGEEEEEDEEELGAVKEMMFKIAAMQPVEIDPATIRKPKRRNVRISDDPQSVAARLRRERISEKIRILQRLVPGGTKMDTASMLDEAIRYVKFLKRHIRHLQFGHHHQVPPPPPPPPVGNWPAPDSTFAGNVLTGDPPAGPMCLNNNHEVIGD